MDRGWEQQMGAWRQFFVVAKPGLKISVFDCGGSGPNLLLCNANGFHALCYRQMVHHLLDRFHCYALDHRGTGDSQLEIPDTAIQEALQNRSEIQPEWLEASSTLPTIRGFAEDICAVARHFSWKECFLFGHSSGGCAVLAAIPRLKGIVKAACIYEPVTIDPTALRECGVIAPESEKLCRRTLRRRDRFASKQAAYEAYSQRGFKHFSKEILRDYVDHGFKETSDGQGVELKCSKNCEALVFALVERMAAEDFHALAHISCPVVVGAGVGGFGGPEMADRSLIVARQLGNGSLKRIHLTHFAPFEDAQFFASWLIKTFLLDSQSRL